MKTEDLSTLQFHALSRQRFEQEKNNGRLIQNEFYLTPAPDIDKTPTEGSENLVTSGAVYNAIKNAAPNLTYDEEPTEGSENLVTSGAIFDAIGDVKTVINSINTLIGDDS